MQDNSGNGYYYIGSLIYSNSNLESTDFSQGRIALSGNTQTIHYHHRDHLGSVRAITNGSGTVIEQNDYYPFGGRHTFGQNYTQTSTNRYKFNGKEEQTLGSLDLLDYGARMYNTKTARWLVQDPLAEKYYSFSSYNYCNNEPINRIDLFGKDWYKNNETGYYVWYEGATERDGYTYIGEKGSVLGEFEYIIDNLLVNVYEGSSMFSHGFSFDITSSEKKAFAIDADNFLTEFINGSGPEVSVLLSNHPYTQDMMTSHNVRDAQKKILEGNTSIPGQITNVAVNWGIIDVFTTDSMAKQFIGSYRYDGYISSDGTNINNVISDSKSRTSFLYHFPFIQNKKRGETNVMSNTYQFYIWKSIAVR